MVNAIYDIETLGPYVVLSFFNKILRVYEQKYSARLFVLWFELN